MNLEVFEVPESSLGQGEGQARIKEGTALLQLLRKGAYTIAVDERGEQYSSRTWSRFLADKKLAGRSHFQLVLGGRLGTRSACARLRRCLLVAFEPDFSAPDGTLYRA